MNPKHAEPSPPHAALQLAKDRRRLFRRWAPVPAQDRFDVAAEWERRARRNVDRAETLARIGRAFLTGTSPRFARGRWLRDLAYLEDVAAEAVRLLPTDAAWKYQTMVENWRFTRPQSIFGKYLARYRALRNRLQQDARGGDLSK